MRCILLLFLVIWQKNHTERPNSTKLRMMSSRLFHKSSLLEKPWPCAWGLPQVGLLFFQRRLLICGLLGLLLKSSTNVKSNNLFYCSLLKFKCILTPIEIICFYAGPLRLLTAWHGRRWSTLEATRWYISKICLRCLWLFSLAQGLDYNLELGT